MKISPPCLSSIWTCHFFPVILPSSKYDHNIPLLSHPVATYEHPSSAFLFLCHLLRGNQILLPFLLLNLITILVKIRLRCVCGLIKGHPISLWSWLLQVSNITWSWIHSFPSAELQRLKAMFFIVLKSLFPSSLSVSTLGWGLWSQWSIWPQALQHKQSNIAHLCP